MSAIILKTLFKDEGELRNGPIRPIKATKAKGHRDQDIDSPEKRITRTPATWHQPSNAKTSKPFSKASAACVYRLRISLQEIRPQIWRCIQIPAGIGLCCLHDVLQIAMGWSNSHLHQFERDGRYYGDSDDDFTDIEMINEEDLPVSRLLKGEGDSLVYVYDFADDWRHDVVLEKVFAKPSATHAICLDGNGRCPPEDVGGASGYREFLRVILDPYREEHLEMRRWIGESFQPEEFDKAAVNKALSQLHFGRHPGP